MADNVADLRREESGLSRLLAVRLAMALVQAAALYLLLEAADAKVAVWLATQPGLFIPSVLIASFVPLMMVLAGGKIPLQSLFVWGTAATLIIALLGLHDATRGNLPAFFAEAAPWPSARHWCALAASLFVAQALVVDSVIESRFDPSYTLHFDTAWQQGVQLALTCFFCLVFWGVLELGAALFTLIKLNFLRDLLTHRWFNIPATTLAIAVAIHVTDVRPSLIRGARSLALTLFSWLGPLLALILLGFLGSLIFVSIKPLWSTHFAANLLLSAAGLLIIFINCAYQDGSLEQTQSKLKRLAGTVAALELLPLTALAIWALGLRVAQYGWSVQRINAAAFTLLLAYYAIGYTSAIIPAKPWLKRIERTNFTAAYVALVLFLALFSPLADPARLMVADQMSRLDSARASTSAFDFIALKFDGARWGKAALDKLSKGEAGSRDPEVKDLATQALAATNRFQRPKPLGQVAAQIAVYPTGRVLTPQLLAAISRDTPACYANSANASLQCAAYFITLKQSEPESLLLFGFNFGYIYQRDVRGAWQEVASAAYFDCNSVGKSVQTGGLQLAPHPWPDAIVGGKRLEFNSWPPSARLGGHCGVAPAPQFIPSPAHS